MTRPSPEEVRTAVATIGTWYHVMELAPGVVTPGAYDLRPLLPQMCIPESLAGQTVLDIGTANGFFAFEMERRGAARVIATNIESYRDHDYPHWYLERLAAAQTAAASSTVDHHEVRGGFEVAREALQSQVELRYVRIYDMPDVIPERFDFAFCGALLVHLRDPVAGIEAIRRVLKPGGRLVITTPVDLSAPELPFVLFQGIPESVSWWVMSPAALIRMCRMAGFGTVTWRGSFDFASKHDTPIIDTYGVVECELP